MQTKGGNRCARLGVKAQQLCVAWAHQLNNIVQGGTFHREHEYNEYIIWFKAHIRLNLRLRTNKANIMNLPDFNLEQDEGDKYDEFT